MFCDSVYEIREENGIRKKRGMEEPKDVCKRVKANGSRTKTVGAGMKTRRNSLPVLFLFLSPFRSRGKARDRVLRRKQDRKIAKNVGRAHTGNAIFGRIRINRDYISMKRFST